MQVTGGTGFLGGHILHQLLEGGHKVRAYVSSITILSFCPLTSCHRIVRSGKGGNLQEAYAQYGAKFDTVVVDDLVIGDFTDALKGWYDSNLSFQRLTYSIQALTRSFMPQPLCLPLSRVPKRLSRLAPITCYQHFTGFLNFLQGRYRWYIEYFETG